MKLETTIKSAKKMKMLNIRKLYKSTVSTDQISLYNNKIVTHNSVFYAIGQLVRFVKIHIYIYIYIHIYIYIYIYVSSKSSDDKTG